MREAGFVDVAVHPHEEAIAFESVDEMWERMIRSSAHIVMLRKRLGEDEWATRAKVARAWLRDTIGPTPTKLSTLAYLAVGARPR